MSPLFGVTGQVLKRRRGTGRSKQIATIFLREWFAQSARRDDPPQTARQPCAPRARMAAPATSRPLECRTSHSDDRSSFADPAATLGSENKQLAKVPFGRAFHAQSASVVRASDGEDVPEVDHQQLERADVDGLASVRGDAHEVPLFQGNGELCASGDVAIPQGHDRPPALPVLRGLGEQNAPTRLGGVLELHRHPVAHRCDGEGLSLHLAHDRLGEGHGLGLFGGRFLLSLGRHVVLSFRWGRNFSFQHW